MTLAEIRAEYTMQLWDALAELAAPWDSEERRFVEENPGCTWAPRQEFMNELFDCGDCEWVYANTFRFWHPRPYVLDQRTLDIIGKPDVCWVTPSIGAATVDGEARLYTEVTVIDGDDFLDVNVPDGFFL